MVVPARSQAQRRQAPLERESQAAAAPLETSARAAARPEAGGHADAAAATLRALPSASHWGEGEVPARPQSGPGRPSAPQPRVVKARRYGVPLTLHARAAGMARQRQEGGGCGLLTNGPTGGEMAQSARAVLQASKDPPGIEQNYGFLQDPLIVNNLVLTKPERIEALGLGVLWARLGWRLVESTLRVPVETTGKPCTGGTRRPRRSRRPA